MSLQGNYNTVTWTAVTGAASYTVYKGDNGAPGYIGSVLAPTLTFKDRNLLSILSDTPPLGTNPFGSAGNYPSTVMFHQRRLFLGRTRNRPNAIFASQSADFENMDKAQITKADDSLSFALVTEKVNAVNQLSSMKRLLALTGDAIFSITGGGDGTAITPSAIDPQRETGRGASRLNPIVVDSVLFYEPRKTAGVRALGFTFEADGYRGNDVTLFSPHFFKSRHIIDWAYQETPYSCIWTVLDNGTLLCFTWEEEQQVWGWTKMETEGFVERVAVITENGVDRLYALIRRDIAGVIRRFHEWLALPHVTDRRYACHLDCAVTQISEQPSDVIDQLWHLEGATVSATYDGYVVHDLVVENGQVTLPHEATIRTAGLRYEGLIETLPPVLSGTDHTNRQNIGDVTVRAIDTRGLEVSADGTQFDPFPEREGETPYLLPEGGLHDFTLPVQGNWSDGATVTIRQSEPLPAQIVAMFIEPLVSDPRGVST
jgi:hypothetical protein